MNEESELDPHWPWLVVAWEMLYQELESMAENKQLLWLCPMINGIADKIGPRNVLAMTHEINKLPDLKGFLGKWPNDDLESRRAFIKKQIYGLSYDVDIFEATQPVNNSPTVAELRRNAMQDEANKQGFISWKYFESIRPITAAYKLEDIRRRFPFKKKIVPNETMSREYASGAMFYRLVNGTLEYHTGNGSWTKHPGSEAILTLIKHPTIEVEDVQG